MHARPAMRVAPSAVGVVLAFALALALALALAGCSSSRSGVAAPTSSPTSPLTTSAVVSTPATTSAPATARSHPSSCAQESPKAIPDGRWTGPVILHIVGRSGSVSGIASGKRGTLTLHVAGGKVTTGTFSFAFTAIGKSSKNGTVVSVRFAVTEHGTVSGPASGPVLTGTSALSGTAKVTSPIQLTTPLSFSGPVTATSTLTATTCSAVTADFLPSLNKQVDKYFGGAKVDTGTEIWTGHPA